MLRLVTISRISKEKGFERMLKFEQMLKDAKIDFIWNLYGDGTTRYAKAVLPKMKYINFKGVTDKPKEMVKQYDYLVQLSDTEGFPYSIYEAMQQKVAVISTDFPSIHEMITDGKNGFIINKNLLNFDIQKITNVPVIKSFKEKSTEQDWIKFIDMARKKRVQAETKPVAKKETVETTKPATNGIVTVKVIRAYHDTELDKILPIGKKHKVTAQRAEQLLKAKVAEIV
jgi:hypothetical protein